MVFRRKPLIIWLLDIHKRNISFHYTELTWFDLALLWVLLVYLRALFTYLLSSLLSHRQPHPETDSFGAEPLSYSILVQYHAWLQRNTLKDRVWY
jgi:hypothetical protein